jgi:hypothetical protein
VLRKVRLYNLLGSSSLFSFFFVTFMTDQYNMKVEDNPLQCSYDLFTIWKFVIEINAVVSAFVTGLDANGFAPLQRRRNTVLFTIEGTATFGWLFISFFRVEYGENCLAFIYCLPMVLSDFL